jgi:hypothetical protein
MARRDAILPAGVRQLVGPVRAVEALVQIVEVGLRDGDAERSDLVTHAADATTNSGQFPS